MSDARAIVQSHAADVEAIQRLVKPSSTHSNRSASHPDSMVVESSFLLMTCYTEAAVDDLFWNTLVHKEFLGSTIEVVQNFNSLTSARQLFASNGYLNWLPYNRVKDNFGKFFNGENPFCRLTNDWSNILAQCVAMRNFIAHRSPESVGKLSQIPAVFRPTSRQDTVATYLLSIHSGNLTQFDMCAQAYKEWISSICRDIPH